MLELPNLPPLTLLLAMTTSAACAVHVYCRIVASDSSAMPRPVPRPLPKRVKPRAQSPLPLPRPIPILGSSSSSASTVSPAPRTLFRSPFSAFTRVRPKVTFAPHPTVHAYLPAAPIAAPPAAPPPLVLPTVSQSNHCLLDMCSLVATPSESTPLQLLADNAAVVPCGAAD